MYEVYLTTLVTIHTHYAFPHDEHTLNECTPV